VREALPTLAAAFEGLRSLVKRYRQAT
jgi:hypothetical protein